MLRGLGHQVTTASISPYRTDAGANDILLDPYQNNWVFRVPSHFELRLARAASFSEAIRGRVGQIFQQAAPEVLWLEHPFLWSVFKPIASSLGLPVVYSSHNVEWKMKRELLAAKNICDPLEVYDIKLIEEDLARRAAAIFCCSGDDAEYYRRLSTKKVSVVPNGANVPLVQDVERAFYTIRFFCDEAFAVPTFCYVSSDHQPNWQGLYDLVLNPMASRYLETPIVLLLIGKIGNLFQEWVENQNFPSWWLKVVTVTEASEDVKNLSLLFSDAILLPIVAGGGTNLKTAEALLAGKKIIATSKAFRGFEKFMQDDYVSIVDRPEDYRDALEAVVNAPRRKRTSISANFLATMNRRPNFQGLRDEVSWEAIGRNAAPDLQECFEVLNN
jgi:hypothetical protein